MHLTRDFKENIIGNMYDQGYRDLKIISGSVSPIMIERILGEFNELNLKIYIGMVAKNGISEWTHQAFQHLVRRYPNRLEIYYHVSLPAQHSNIYFWENPLLLGLEERIFVGSAAFTLNGFHYQNETVVSYDNTDIEDIFNSLDPIACNDINIETAVTIHSNLDSELAVTFEEPLLNTLGPLDQAHMDKNFEYIDIPLTIRKTGETPPKSGINWGHDGPAGLRQPSRTGNETYLSISQYVHRANPNFLPNRREKLLILTDDGEMFVGVVAQENRKAIETSDNNSILGSYLRNRIGVPSGSYVEATDLNQYGRDSIRLFKIYEGLYYLDFKADLTLGNSEERLEDMDLMDRGSEILIEEDGMRILGETVFIRVPELNIDIYNGWLCSWDDNENDFIADSDLIIIKRIGTDEILYDEGGSSLIVAVSNYCHVAGLRNEMDYLETLECEIIE